MEKKLTESLLEGKSSPPPEYLDENVTKHVCFESIRVYELKDGEQKRTEIRSIKIGPKGYQTVLNVLLCLVLYSICFFSETVYKESLLDFSLSKEGIPWIQRDDVTSKGVKRFFEIMTKLGGGKEMLAWFIVAFLFQRRSCAVYVCSILALDKLINSYIKLLYANPRPYMIEKDIIPIDCSTSFGSPSGHASSSAMVATTLFLHVFHGYTHRENEYMERKNYRLFFGYITYFASLFVALFWFFGIPFSRYLMGVHSLDQLLFGNSLGLVGGFTMHFLVRDHLIRNFDDLLEWQRKLDYIPCSSNEQHQKNSQLSEEEKTKLQKQSLDKSKIAIIIVIYLILFTYVAIATFFKTDAIYRVGSKETVIKDTTYDMMVKNWNESKCKEEEGEWDMTYSLQNACLNACGYQWFLCGIYIMSCWRHKIWSGSKKYHTMDADSWREFAEGEQGWNKEENWFRIGLTKLVVMGVLGALCAPPALIFKLKTFESAGNYAGVIIMITNIVIPGFIAAFLFVGGPFDAIMMRVLGCGKVEEKDTEKEEAK